LPTLPGYDAIGRRESVENSGNAFTQTRHNIYSYNNRNEVTGSVRKEGAVENPVATVDSEGRLYEYDPIGNRTRVTEGNATPQLTTYTTDVTNRYTALSGGVSASPAYDDDGNMTAYNGAAYTWNAENRLVSVEKADKKITFLYDYMGRRVQRKVFGGTPGSWNTVPDETRVFVYDGWNLIKETVTGDTDGDTYYVWGLDLSQSMQGAGGIGGLVCRVSGTAVRHYTYDANGNVGQLVDEAGAITARYEYDPFGNEIRAEGDDAQNNPFRFSTKYLDAETGLYYYGFRYYSAEIGRWISRDPIGERGGINIYGFAGNVPTVNIDPLGLDWGIRIKGGIRIVIGVVGEGLGIAGMGIGATSEGATIGASSPVSIPLMIGSAAIIGISHDQIITGYNELMSGENRISSTEAALGYVGELDREYDITGHLITLETGVGQFWLVPITEGVAYGARACSYYVVEVRAIRLNSVLRSIGSRGVRNEKMLTPAQQEQIFKHIEELGLNSDDFLISSHMSVYSDNWDKVFLGPNVFQASSRTANTVFETMSPRAVIAHEAGHMITTRSGRAFEAGSLFDEVGASLAGRELPGLSNVEKYQLLRDAVERAKIEGKNLREVLSQMKE